MLIAHDEAAVLLTNGAPAAVQMKQRKAVVLRVHLCVVPAADQIGTRERRQFHGVTGHRQFAREDRADERLRLWIR